MGIKDEEKRCLMLGMDGVGLGDCVYFQAGKTTILYHWKLNENMLTIPTIGFNVEVFQYRDRSFTVWDV